MNSQQPVSMRDMIKALQIVYEVVAKLDPDESAFEAGTIAMVSHWKGKPKARAIALRVMLLGDLIERPTLKRAWTRETQPGCPEVADALIYAAAQIPITNWRKIKTRDVHQLAKTYADCRKD